VFATWEKVFATLKKCSQHEKRCSQHHDLTADMHGQAVLTRTQLVGLGSTANKIDNKLV
jgi:hypothetical protein